MAVEKFIHLLYVPTKACNMQCSYCYLGDQTRDGLDTEKCVQTLHFALKKLRDAGVLPFTLSLHGGEVTTLQPEVFRELVEIIAEHYRENRSLLEYAGFPVGHPHIKTNLYQLDRHVQTIADYAVSVSGSLDLPLSLHRCYRKTKGGTDTLDRILRNIELLRNLPGRKKVSATIFREHYERIDEIIRDIWFLHRETCLDMNDFNFMIGFASTDAAQQLTPLTMEEQVDFYNRIHAAFDGTELEEGMNRAWFAEFSPQYCTNCDNCGEKFFLLENNGDVYSCVRGQGHPEFLYGNIFRDSVEDILAAARRQILDAHRRTGFDEACGHCRYLYLCKTGCPFVKNVYGSPRSYTCLLQQELYKAMPLTEPPENFTFQYLSKLHPELAPAWYRPAQTTPGGAPSLAALIARDPALQKVYDPGAFVLNVDGTDYPLESQILKLHRDMLLFVPGMTKVILYIRKDVLGALTDYPVNNAVYLMMLTGDTVVYGDEQREKQAHVFTHQVHGYALDRMASDREGWYRLDLTRILEEYAPLLSIEKPNNLFVTTAALRDYHYTKHKNNAYYHIQAINLPFQNMEFRCIPLWPGKTEVNYEHSV